MAEELIHIAPLALLAITAYLAVALPVASLVGRLLARASAPLEPAATAGASSQPADVRWALRSGDAQYGLPPGGSARATYARPGPAAARRSAT